MKEPVLVALAAGIGSRYGGLKQMEPIGPNGEILIDYSVYDAVKAGFRRAIFIITRELEAEFEKRIGARLRKHIDIDYAYQEQSDLPTGFAVPEGRTKPWGTAHALMSARNLLDGPFAVINADDYYGPTAYKLIFDFLNNPERVEGSFAMVGYRIEETVSERGSVARGICEVDAQDYLTAIEERTRIEAHEDGISYSEDGGAHWTPVPKGTVVSMNCWGVDTSYLERAGADFAGFLTKALATNPLKCEYFLPSVVRDMLSDREATVKVFTSPDKWYGITYQEDKISVAKALAEKHNAGEYPALI